MNTMLEKRRSLVKNKKGFTLIELIVVIVIIGILAAILIPRMTGFTKKAEGTEAMVHAKQVATAADALIAEKPDTTPAAIDIADLAGDDIAAGNIADVKVENGHVTFTYNGVSGFTAKRASDGAITVTPN